MTATPLSRQTLFDTLRRSALRHPNKLAIKQGNRQWSYSEFSNLCLRLAQGLTQIGIRPGDRLAILSRNSAEFAATRYAIAASGAVLVPVNFMLNPQEVAYILRHSGARMLFVGKSELPTAQAAAQQCSDIEKLVWLPSHEGIDTPPGLLAFDQLLADTPYSDDPGISASTPAQIIYTSGTESAPKGAVLSHEAVIWQYGSILVDTEVATDDTLLHAMPLYHCAQLDCFLGPSLHVGGSNVITADPDPDNLLELLSGEGITSFFAPPTVWISLLNSPKFDRVDLSRLQKGYYGASIMPVEIMKELLDRLPQIRLWNLYGQTEIAPFATVLKPQDQLRKPGSAGKPALHVETRVVDENDRDVDVGEIGEIVHRSPQLLSEYYRDPEKTAAAFKGGWFHSGDLATIDAEGYLTIVDRKKDMINSGGENVSGREVEEAVYQHPYVAEVAVIGLPHPRWIEAVTAVVVPKAGSEPTEEAVIEHCKARLAPFKVPKRVITTQALPKNPSGKILKRNLRETHAALYKQ